MQIKKAFVFGLLMLSLLACNEEERIIDNFSRENVLEIIRSEMAWQNMNSVVFCVVKGDQVLWTEGLGYANRSKKIFASPETRYIIASISKTITAVAFMKLVEEGLVGLDDPINDYLPFQVVHPQFTNLAISPRMLLSHSSAISDDFYIQKDLFCFGFDCPESLEEFLARVLVPGGDLNDPLNFYSYAPGTEANYSNLNFALIGLLIERISGKSFDAYTKEILFEPLGMTKSEWFLENTPENELAIPYSPTWTGKFNSPHFNFPDYPAGSLRATVGDVAAFLQMLIKQGNWQGEQIMQSETLETMQMPLFTIERGGLRFDYCLGMYYRHFGNEYLLGHGGGEQGITSEMVFDPETEVGVVVFTNTTSIISMELITYALYKYGLEE